MSFKEAVEEHKPFKGKMWHYSHPLESGLMGAFKKPDEPGEIEGEPGAPPTMLDPAVLEARRRERDKAKTGARNKTLIARRARLERQRTVGSTALGSPSKLGAAGSLGMVGTGA
jgi:hypothetical protein